MKRRKLNKRRKIYDAVLKKHETPPRRKIDFTTPENRQITYRILLTVIQLQCICDTNQNF